MAKRSKIVHSNYFTIYDRVWGASLMAEARQRGLSRSELVRVATEDYLRRYPATSQGNPNGQIQDR